MCYDSSIVKTDLTQGYLSSTVSTTNLNASKIWINIGEYLGYSSTWFHEFKCDPPRAMAKCVKEQSLRQGRTYACKPLGLIILYKNGSSQGMLS
jgi:hypothetical protein